MAGPPHNRAAGPHITHRPSFIALWVIASILWTLSTALRIERVWVPVLGWSAVLGSVYAWVSLLLPLWLFAVILLAIKRIASVRRAQDG